MPYRKKINALSKKQIALLIFIILVITPQIIFAKMRTMQISLNPKPSAQIEGSICTNCVVRATRFSVIPQLGQVQTGAEQLFDAATFINNNPRSFVIDIRRRLANGEILTNTEMAVLRASAQTGEISCVGSAGKNGTLVQFQGRDAVITSAHGFIDSTTGQPKCDLSTVGFFPNLSFHDSELGPLSDFEKRMVNTTSHPLNLASVLGRGKINMQNDYLIFFLDEQISSDQLNINVNGQNQIMQRGFMSFDISNLVQGPIYFIGLNARVRRFTATTYQECNSEQNEEALFHTCDSEPSTSSSALVRIIGNEAFLTGINLGQIAGLADTRQLPKDGNITSEGNIALPINEIFESFQ